jgi:hypothetical protein
MRNSTIRHEMLPITRPTSKDGTPVVRTRVGWRGGRASDGKLSSTVCATCVYGPTPRQQARLDAGKPVKHTATPLAFLLHPKR